ncbi:MAG: redoxin family protein [Oceanococcus sp.]
MMLRFQKYILCLSLCFTWPVFATPAEQAPAAPEFTQPSNEAWINSSALSLSDLKGQVVLIEFWTYGCGNCLRSIPWVKAMSERYAEAGLRVIGIHTPEFSHERSRQAVLEQTKALAIRHPIMLDNDYSYWNAMGNRYWPAFYLLDKQGRVRQAWAGEVRNGSPRGRMIQSAIVSLLAE